MGPGKGRLAALLTLFLLSAVLIPSPAGSHSLFLPNEPPEADAGSDIGDVYLNDVVTLNGSGSTDENIENCTWVWECISHPSITISPENSSVVTFTVSVVDTITFLLNLSDPSGLYSTDDVDIQISENSPPSPVIAFPPPSGIEGPFFPISTLIEFSANGTSDPEGRELSYSWTSNVSGLLSHQKFFQTTIEDIGWHRITLNVSDPNGGWAVESIDIKIREDLSPPEASIYLKPSRPTMEYLKSEFITLDGSQTIDANTGEQLNFTWSTNLSGGIILGYGEELELKMDEGHHNITLLVVDSDGLEGISWVHITVLNTAPRALISTPGMKFRAGEPTVNVSEKASFSATLSSDQDMDELVFFWDFGDSTTEVGENVTKSWNFFGPFNVTLTVDDGSVQRSEDEIEFTIYVNSIPEVSVDTGVQVEIDERFTISANGSRDQDGDELDYLWDFDGDGVWDASGFNATWKYAVEDDHEVTLRASDGFAWDDIKTIVSVVYPNDRPVARLANELIDGEVIVSLDDNKGDVELDASPSIDPDDDVNGNDEIDGDEESNLTYTWDVDPEEDSDGDGIDNNDADEEGRKVNVEMKKSGTMKIILNVSDPRGLYDTLEIKLRGNNPPGSLSIHVGPSSRVLVGAQVTLTGSARDPDRSDSNKLEYHWSYGDGKNSTNPSFQSFHRYQEEGSYDVVLRVTDGLLYAETRTTIAVVELDEPSLTYPSNGSEVSGLLTLRGSIREVTGFDVDQVDVKVGSRDWDKAEGTSSWTYDINTARYPDGELKIKVRYTVDNSIESTTEITVQVSNNSGSGNGILVPVIVIIALLLLLVVIYFVFLRRKPRSFEEYLPPPPGRGPVPPRGLPPSAPKASLPAPGGTPQPPKKDEPPQTQPPGIEDDRPRSFRIKCPSCGKLFRSLDSGERPLHITCKHCGANGVVESIPGDEESEGTEEEEPAEDEPDPVPIVCPSCGGLFELDEMSETAKCPYCGVEGELDEDTLSMLKERFSEEDEELTLKCPTCMGTFKVKGEKGPIICPYCGSKGKAAS